MKINFSLAIATLVALVSAEATYPAAARDKLAERHACSIACSGRTGGGCGAYKVSQQRCFNKCMGYEACPGVGFPTTEETK
jgi:hypothetical protein